VLILSGIHFIRFFASMDLPPLPFSVPSWYFLATGAIWGLVGAVIAFGLFSGRRWAPNVLRGGSLAYVIWFWLDQILLIQAEYAQARFVSSAIATLLVLVFIFLTLQRPGTKSFFREAR
jgi:hypothetical protein